MGTRSERDNFRCHSCGEAVEPGSRFCGFCGTPLNTSIFEVPPVQAPRDETLARAYRARDVSYLIPTQRVLLMTLVSHGLYLFYWFYVTWKQYQEHTGEEAYPVWHALCLFVPIYNLFRIHAHMRTYRELMEYAGVTTSISAGMGVVLILTSSVLDVAGTQLNGGLMGTAPVAAWAPMAALVLSLISLAVLAAVLIQTQGNLNRYWESVAEGSLSPAGFGVGEVVFGLLGTVAWIATIALVTGVVEPIPPPQVQ